MNLQIGDIVIPLPPFGQLVFLLSGGLATLASIMMITRRKAVHSALWLVAVFFNIAVMYVMLGAEFLAALQVLVYTGAILVLFLFVIMLLGLQERGPRLGGLHTAQLVAAWPVGLLLMIQIIIITLFSNQPQQVNFGDTIGDTPVLWNAAAVTAIGGNVQALGNTLYTQFLLPFEVASLILLLAVIGAIVLARKEEPAEVEEVLPSLGISIGRRSVANSPQEDQIEKTLLPALGVTAAPDASMRDRGMPIIEQPSGVGAGTTSGVEVQPPAGSPPAAPRNTQNTQNTQNTPNDEER
jgi:NADH-quinone oxidoreductase subunit J